MIGMAAVIFTGLIARMWMLLSSKSLWGDEFYSIEYASGERLTDVIRYCLGTNHPPLYYYFIRFSSGLFGPTDIGYRAASTAAGVITVWLIYRLARNWFGRSTAALSALLAAISPYYLQSSNEIRAYGVLTLFAVLAMHLAIKAEKRSGYYVPAMILSASLLPYIEHMGIVVSAGIMCYFLVRRNWHMMLPQVCVGVMQIPWAALVFYQAVYHEKAFQISRVNEYWNLPWMVKKTAGIVWHLISGYRFSMLTVDQIVELLKTSPGFYLEAGTVMICVCALIFMFRRLLHVSASFVTLLFLTLLIPGSILLAAYPIRLDARYLGFAAPLFTIALIQSIRLIRLRPLRAAVFSALFMANILGSIYAIGLNTDAMHKQDFKGMAEFAAQAAGERSGVVGWGLIYRFYAKSSAAASASRARMFDDLNGLTIENTADLDEVWFLNEVNMHDAVTENLLADVAARMSVFGFVEDRRKRFGGENGLTMAVRYKRAAPGQF